MSIDCSVTERLPTAVEVAAYIRRGELSARWPEMLLLIGGWLDTYWRCQACGAVWNETRSRTNAPRRRW
jgi:hypothetical protein